MTSEHYDPAARQRAVQLRDKYREIGDGIRDEIASEIKRYLWCHTLEIVPGVVTEGEAWSPRAIDTFVAGTREIDFSGKRVLDVGCRDGAMLLAAEERGAAELYGVDNDFSPGLMNFLIPFKSSKIQCVEANIHRLDKENLGTFDIVICCGLLYHLPFPFWGIKQLRDMVRIGGILILETAVLDAFEDFPMLLYATGETSPYEPTSVSFFNLAGLRHALGLMQFADVEVRDRYAAGRVDIARHFPDFARGFGARGLKSLFRRFRGLPVNRAFITCARVEGGMVEGLRTDGTDNRPYFEGIHRQHSLHEE